LLDYLAHLDYYISMNLRDIRNQLKKHNTSLRLLNGRYAFVDYERVSGWFDDANPNKKIISVATARPRQEWLSVLYHEFCHLRQEITNHKTHRFATIRKTDEFCGNIYTEYLQNSRKISKKKAKMALRRVVALELDCEIRTIKLMKKSGRFSAKYINKYIRRTNSDLFEYIFDFKYRKFKLSQKSVQFNELIQNTMPDKLMSLDYYFKNFDKYKIFYETLHFS
jgi:hypothetical protein